MTTAFAQDRQLQNKLLAADDIFDQPKQTTLSGASALRPSNLKDSKFCEVTGWSPDERVVLRRPEHDPSLSKPKTSVGAREYLLARDRSKKDLHADSNFSFHHYPESHRYIEQYRREHTCTDSINSASTRNAFLELQRFYAYRAHAGSPLYTHPATMVGYAPQTQSTKRDQSNSTIPHRSSESNLRSTSRYKLSPNIHVRGGSEGDLTKDADHSQRDSPVQVGATAAGSTNKMAIHAVSKTPFPKVPAKVKVPANAMISPSLNRTVRTSSRKISSPKVSVAAWESAVGAVRTLDTLACVAAPGDKESDGSSNSFESDAEEEEPTSDPRLPFGFYGVHGLVTAQDPLDPRLPFGLYGVHGLVTAQDPLDPRVYGGLGPQACNMPLSPRGSQALHASLPPASGHKTRSAGAVSVSGQPADSKALFGISREKHLDESPAAGFGKKQPGGTETGDKRMVKPDSKEKKTEIVVKREEPRERHQSQEHKKTEQDERRVTQQEAPRVSRMYRRIGKLQQQIQTQQAERIVEEIQRSQYLLAIERSSKRRNSDENSRQKTSLQKALVALGWDGSRRASTGSCDSRRGSLTSDRGGRNSSGPSRSGTPSSNVDTHHRSQENLDTSQESLKSKENLSSSQETINSTCDSSLDCIDTNENKQKLSQKPSTTVPANNDPNTLPAATRLFPVSLQPGRTGERKGDDETSHLHQGTSGQESSDQVPSGYRLTHDHGQVTWGLHSSTSRSLDQIHHAGHPGTTSTSQEGDTQGKRSLANSLSQNQTAEAAGSSGSASVIQTQSMSTTYQGQLPAFPARQRSYVLYKRHSRSTFRQFQQPYQSPRSTESQQVSQSQEAEGKLQENQEQAEASQESPRKSQSYHQEASDAGQGRPGSLTSQKPGGVLLFHDSLEEMAVEGSDCARRPTTSPPRPSPSLMARQLRVRELLRNAGLNQDARQVRVVFKPKATPSSVYRSSTTFAKPRPLGQVGGGARRLDQFSLAQSRETSELVRVRRMGVDGKGYVISPRSLQGRDSDNYQ